VLDTSIKRVTAGIMEKSAEVAMVPVITEKVVVEETLPEKKLGIVFNFNSGMYPGFTIDAIQGDANDEGKKFIGKVRKNLTWVKFVNTAFFNEEDKQLLQQVRKTTKSEVDKYLDRNSPFSGIWEKHHSYRW